MPGITPLARARNAVATASRLGNPEKVAEARRNLSETHVETAIRKALATAPPLTDEQRERLAALLVGGAK